jgi:hypothetical protein
LKKVEQTRIAKCGREVSIPSAAAISFYFHPAFLLPEVFNDDITISCTMRRHWCLGLRGHRALATWKTMAGSEISGP